MTEVFVKGDEKLTDAHTDGHKDGQGHCIYTPTMRVKVA